MQRRMQTNIADIADISSVPARPLNYDTITPGKDLGFSERGLNIEVISEAGGLGVQ